MAKTREGSKLELSRPGPALLQVEKFFDELKRDFCLFWKSLLAGNFEKIKSLATLDTDNFFRDKVGKPMQPLSGAMPFLLCAEMQTGLPLPPTLTASAV